MKVEFYSEEKLKRQILRKDNSIHSDIDIGIEGPKRFLFR